MEKFLANIFRTLPFKCYLTHRLNNDCNCMVYDFLESPNSLCDDEEELTTYTIIIRLYGNANEIIERKNLLKKLLKENDFKKVTIPAQIYDKDLKIYQQALQYTITIDTLALD